MQFPRQASAPTHGNLPTTIGPGEGKLSIVAWPGLLEHQWVKPFEAQTGCKVQSKNAGSSNELVAYMRQGKYDLGAVSADVGRTLIGIKAVAPLNLTLVPAVKSFLPPFRSPVATTVGAAHFGVAIHWAPDELLYNTSKVKPAPTSWGAIYASKHRGQITIPNDPMQIADAALYLMTAKPSLGIRDPYELTTRQLAAAVALLQRQRPLLSGYWNYPADEVQAFQNGHAVIGAGWPWQAATLKAAKVPVSGLVPREGVTGWIDSWMVAAKDKHPNCAYRWLQYASTPSGPGDDGEGVRCRAGQCRGLRRDGSNVDGLVRGVARESDGGVSQLDPVLEDAAGRLRARRREELHGLHGLAAGLESTHGLGGSRCQRR